MTLQPYDGANRVLLPDGRECWEKKTTHSGFIETTYSYQYSIEIGDLPVDYYGRVIGLRLLAPDENWNEVVGFFPVSLNLIDRVRAIMEQDWAVLADHVDGRYLMGSHNYLRICNEVLAMLKSGVRE